MEDQASRASKRVVRTEGSARRKRCEVERVQQRVLSCRSTGIWHCARDTTEKENIQKYWSDREREGQLSRKSSSELEDTSVLGREPRTSIKQDARFIKVSTFLSFRCRFRVCVTFQCWCICPIHSCNFYVWLDPIQRHRAVIMRESHRYITLKQNHPATQKKIQLMQMNRKIEFLKMIHLNRINTCE